MEPGLRGTAAGARLPLRIACRSSSAPELWHRGRRRISALGFARPPRSYPDIPAVELRGDARRDSAVRPVGAAVLVQPNAERMGCGQRLLAGRRYALPAHAAIAGRSATLAATGGCGLPFPLRAVRRAADEPHLRRIAVAVLRDRQRGSVPQLASYARGAPL